MKSEEYTQGWNDAINSAIKTDNEKMEVLEMFHEKDTETIEHLKEELEYFAKENKFLHGIIETLQKCIDNITE